MRPGPATALLVAGAVLCVLDSSLGIGARSAAHAPDLVERVRGLVVSVIHGDLAAAGDTARWLAEHAEPAVLPADTQPSLAAVRSAATEVTAARDVALAATATARLFASCGGCHETARITPTFPRPTPPALGSIAGHMVRHQNSADLMLEGLVVPSPDAWTRGAGQLRVAPLKPGDFPVSDRIGALMAEIETRMHAQAATAAAALDTPGRARAYGTLLTLCAECHTRHTTLWPEGLR